jgi:flagellar biosynthesis/type III secretory pathway M-ring protein FliF/YscJ
MNTDVITASLIALAPSVGVGLLFWFAMRKIFRADRNEREALARLDAEDARRAQESTGTTGSTSSSE